MRKFMFYFMMLGMFLCFSFAESTVNTGDDIGLFLRESVDGKITGKYYHLQITVYRIDDKVEWFASHECFITDDYKKSVSVCMGVSTESWTYDLPLLEGVVWKSGKSLMCKYRAYGGQTINLKISKLPNTKNEWYAVGGGLIHYTDHSDKLVWELKSVKELNLKYPKIELLPGYK